MVEKRLSVSISLPPDLIEAVDARKGYQSRSAWIVKAIQKELERETKTKGEERV